VGEVRNAFTISTEKRSQKMATIEREPRPARTKRGRGAGARLDLSIYYYRAPDGAGDDFGTFYGRDEDGQWELHFANPDEMERQLACLTARLTKVATEAREEAIDRGDAGRAVWLKAIGAQGWPADEIWWNERKREEGIRFPFKPRSIKIGDFMVIYAAGTGKVVGVVEVKSDWFHEKAEKRWPYRMDTVVRVAKPISEGVPLETLSDEREITKSIRQKSHIRLSAAEASKALAAFGIAEDD
jgi:hypothetical protein